jgi:hypothetical protein
MAAIDPLLVIKKNVFLQIMQLLSELNKKNKTKQ